MCKESRFLTNLLKKNYFVNIFVLILKLLFIDPLIYNLCIVIFNIKYTFIFIGSKYFFMWTIPLEFKIWGGVYVFAKREQIYLNLSCTFRNKKGTKKEKDLEFFKVTMDRQ